LAADRAKASGAGVCSDVFIFPLEHSFVRTAIQKKTRERKNVKKSSP